LKKLKEMVEDGRRDVVRMIGIVGALGLGAAVVAGRNAWAFDDVAPATFLAATVLCAIAYLGPRVVGRRSKAHAPRPKPRARRSDRLRRAEVVAVAAPSRPPPTFDDRVRAAVRPGRRAARALLDEINRSKPFIRQYFSEVPERVRRLLVKYAALCRRLTSLEEELDESELARITDERDRLQGRAEETRDAVARKGFTSAVASLDRTLESMERIGRDAERIEAQLAYIEAELESARARVVRIQTSAGVEAAHDRREVESAVRAIDAEVDALSQAVDEVMGETGGAAEGLDADLAASLEEETPPPPTAVVVSAPAGALPLVVPTIRAPDPDEPRRLAQRRKSSVE